MLITIVEFAVGCPKLNMYKDVWRKITFLVFIFDWVNKKCNLTRFELISMVFSTALCYIYLRWKGDWQKEVLEAVFTATKGAWLRMWCPGVVLVGAACMGFGWPARDVIPVDLTIVIDHTILQPWLLSSTKFFVFIGAKDNEIYMFLYGVVQVHLRGVGKSPKAYPSEQKDQITRDIGNVIFATTPISVNDVDIRRRFPAAPLLFSFGFTGPLPPCTRPAARRAGPIWSHLAVGMPRGSGVGTRHNLTGWPAPGLGPFAAAMIANRSVNPGHASLGLGVGCSDGCVQLSPLSDSFLLLEFQDEMAKFCALCHSEPCGGQHESNLFGSFLSNLLKREM
ncbi:hypothetical protein GQX74_009951 [Glossina fuscipes]|nr:hypothetical protein GQX74_009951 [Glossina fuscipes]